MTPPKGITVTQFQMGAPPQPPCAACGTPGYNLGGPWFRCPMCGLGFMDADKRAEIAAKVTDPAFIESRESRAPSFEGELEHKARVAQRILCAFNNLRGRGDTPDGPPGRMYEAGPGNGGIILEFKRRGWDVKGCEATEEATKSLQAEGLDVQKQRFDFPGAGPATPSRDIVVAWDVMEHMFQLKEAFKNAADLTVSGGLLALCSPDFDHYFHDNNHPHFKDESHLWHLTIGSADKLLTEMGFKLWRTERFGTCWGEDGYAHPQNFVAWAVKQ